MNITSEDEALLELYENGKTSDKRYRRLPIQVIKGTRKLLITCGLLNESKTSSA